LIYVESESKSEERVQEGDLFASSKCCAIYAQPDFRLSPSKALARSLRSFDLWILAFGPVPVGKSVVSWLEGSLLRRMLRGVTKADVV
jgi:hypothetical protein